MKTIYADPCTARTTFMYDCTGLHIGMVLPSGLRTTYQYGAVRDWPNGNGHVHTSPQTNPLASLNRGEMDERFGPWPGGELCLGWTQQPDTEVVMQLLLWRQPKVIIEIGTARGDMTANLAHYSREEARVYTVDICREMDIAVPEAQLRSGELLPCKEVGAHIYHFGASFKVSRWLRDSMTLDWDELPRADFVFIDGNHDYDHVARDTREAYRHLDPGGVIVWHDYDSSPGVMQAVEEFAGGVGPVTHVQGTWLAFHISAT